MPSRAYVSWLRQREFKVCRPSAVQAPPDQIEERMTESPAAKAVIKPTARRDGYTTPPTHLKETEATASPRKRPRVGASSAAKLDKLRLIKRRLEGEGDGTRVKRRGDTRGAESGVTTWTRSQGQRQQNTKRAVLLEESSYWLVVQKFSQLT
jgi:hypothetical protein